jgi:hypothetical protein
LQVGLTTYTDWNVVSAGWNEPSPVQPYHQNRIVNQGIGNPDVVADVEFFRLSRPSSEMDATDLQSVQFTGPNGPVRELAATPLIQWLGDSAAQPPADPGLTYPEWISQHLPAEDLANPDRTNPFADSLGSGMPNVLRFLFGTISSPMLEAVDNGQGGTSLRYLVGRNPDARGWRLTLETSSDLTEWTTVGTSENGAPATGPGVEGEISGTPPHMVIGPGVSPDPATRRFYRTRAEPLEE